jgi:uncharacterized lipoprotein YajG
MVVKIETIAPNKTSVPNLESPILRAISVTVKTKSVRQQKHIAKYAHCLLLARSTSSNDLCKICVRHFSV